MSNEKTILPNSVLVSLYKDTLVLPELAQKKQKLFQIRWFQLLRKRQQINK